MSLPTLSIAGTIRASLAAVSLATDAVQRLSAAASDGVTFDSVLNPSKSPTQPPGTSTLDGLASDASEPVSLERRFIDSARELLTRIGIGQDRSVQVGFDASGTIAVAGGDADVVLRSLEIESALNRTPLTEFAQELFANRATTTNAGKIVTIDLDQAA